MSVVQFPRCAECGGPLPAPKPTGRPRRYCSDACRERAKTRRRGTRAVGWQSLAVQLPAIPDDPYTHRLRTLEAVADLLDGAPAAPPEDRLAQALIETRQLVWQLRRLADLVAPALRARALGLHDAIVSGLERYFGEVML